MALVEKFPNLVYFAAFCNETGSPRCYRSGKKNGRMGVSGGRSVALDSALGYSFSSEWDGLLYRGALSGSRAPEGRSSHQPAISTRRISDGLRTSCRLWSEPSRSHEVLNVLLSGEQRGADGSGDLYHARNDRDFPAHCQHGRPNRTHSNGIHTVD
jgi:hypothetical protein